jgi:hypothetical protein
MHPMTLTSVATIRQFPVLLSTLVLIVLSLCLVGFQPPPPDGTGSGVVNVRVVYATGGPAHGITVQYVDEWQRRVYGTCITDGQGVCRMVIENAPTLGVLLRGVLEIEESDRVQDAMLMVNESVTVSVMLDAGGAVTVDADVLATRDPNVTPTLIGVEDALATLTAAASEPLATPSPGIERTVASAHRAMTATAVVRASLTPTPRVTPTASRTPNVGFAVVVNNTPIPVPEPETSAPGEDSQADGVTLTELTQVGAWLTAMLLISSLVLLMGGAWWIRRRRSGGMQ